MATHEFKMRTFVALVALVTFVALIALVTLVAVVLATLALVAYKAVLCQLRSQAVGAADSSGHVDCTDFDSRVHMRHSQP